jgi:hypothetical protein
MIYILVYHYWDDFEIKWVGMDKNEALERLYRADKNHYIQVWENGRLKNQYYRVRHILEFEG